MVLAKKPLTWLQVMYKRLKHLIISSDTFREKKRTVYNPQVKGLSPSTADVCEALRQLTSVKTEWSWNATYKKLFNRAKSIIKADACIKFYDEFKPLYLETDASCVGLGASLLQTRYGASCPRDMVPDNNILWPIIFTSKSLSSTEIQQ